jgi:hypothetical protein
MPAVWKSDTLTETAVASRVFNGEAATLAHVLAQRLVDAGE